MADKENKNGEVVAEPTVADAAKAVGCAENEVLGFKKYPTGYFNVVTKAGRKLTNKPEGA